MPLIKPHCGLRLPPDRHCLLSVNYKLRATEVQPKKLTKSALERGAAKNKSTGAAIIKRQTMGSISKTQTVSIPKPVFKLSGNGNAKLGEASSSTNSAEPKPQPTPITSIIQEVKMEVDDGYSNDSKGTKRKHDDDDDFEIVE